MKKESIQALFLDRDGTLIYDADYLKDPDKVVLIPGVKKALKKVLGSGCRLFLLTNQSGIGRGYFTMADYEACHKRMLELLELNVTDWTACGIAPENVGEPSKYRKPNPAFIQEQLAILPELVPSRCFMIGDRKTDCQTGLNAKIKAACVRTGKIISDEDVHYYRENQIEIFDSFPDFVEKYF